MNEATIVAMIANLGAEALLENALVSLTRAGIGAHIVYVARPDSSGSVIDPILRKFGAHGISFSAFGDTEPVGLGRTYADYGSLDFVAINWAKVRYLRWLLDKHRHVVYSDIDVVWLSDPLWYLQRVAEHFPLAFQSEALRQFPPVLCWGFVSLVASAISRGLLDEMLLRRQLAIGHLTDEQTLCNAIFAGDPAWLTRAYALPEALFINGLGWKALAVDEPKVPIHGKLAPFIFHANWTIGLESKRALMARVGAWMLDEEAVC